MSTCIKLWCLVILINKECVKPEGTLLILLAIIIKQTYPVSKQRNFSVAKTNKSGSHLLLLFINRR